MHLHPPKPVHGWRAFFGEVGIIVIGVLIALGAEQVVETVHWNEKVHIAQENVGEELNALLIQSYEATQLDQCAPSWIDAAESAVSRGSSAALQILFDGQPPFSPRNWRSTAWQTMMSTQVADHLDKRYLNKQAFLFSPFEDIRRCCQTNGAAASR